MSCRLHRAGHDARLRPVRSRALSLRVPDAVRIAPHVNDTLLLAAAIALAVLSRQYPFAEGWLTAKVLGLVAYIGIGTVAMRPGRPRHVRVAAWAAGLGVLAYIVGVAVTRNPRIFF